MMYSNNILNFQESTRILNACTKKKLIECTTYINLARELKELWNMKVTFKPFIFGALDTDTEGLVQGLEDSEITGRVETIQTTALLKSIVLANEMSQQGF